jgi:hypothetical protein
MTRRGAKEERTVKAGKETLTQTCLLWIILSFTFLLPNCLKEQTIGTSFFLFCQHFRLVHAERHEICEKSKVERPKRRKSLGTVLGTCRRKQFVGQSMSPRHNQVYVLYSFFISTGSHLVGNRST